MSEAMTLALRQPTAMMPLSTGSLDAYIAHVNRAPLLDAAAEHELAVELRDQQNLGAAQQLVMSNLRHVVHIARGYLGYGLPLGDLIQEGNIGLMKAVKRFDPDVGVRLISFAVHWIKAEIHEFILKNWRIVKIATTKAQRKLFFNLRSQKKSLGWLNLAEAEAIAADLKVKPEEVFQMEARLSGHDVSFNATPSDDEESSYRPEDWLASDADAAGDLEEAEWQDARETRMERALTTLDPRSRDILQRRWLNEDSKTGLQELADEYGVSAERIRQIEAAAMKKLRKVIEEPVEA
ncbi:RNA polymerase sigma factor RpoH [Solimonas terrae]|nr:RNA polymerase sigma factor RpoH [Solimonas terrae]